MQHAQVLLSLNVGPVASLDLPRGTTRSAIVKTPVEEPLMLTENGLATDEQADRRAHGGPDKAVCVYPVEHYPFWRSRLGRDLDAGAFGENFTTNGLLESEVCIGDTYAVGDAVVQVTQPRSPCFRLAARLGYPEMAKAVVSTGYTGFYLRTLQPGPVGSGARVTLLARPSPAVTVRMTNDVSYASRPAEADLLAVIEARGLASGWRLALEEQLRRLSGGSH